MTTMNASMRAASRLREIKRNYPYQLALPDRFCNQENFAAIRGFCEGRFGHAAPCFNVIARWEDGGDQDMRIHCFATPEHAAEFGEHFEAEPFSEEECHRSKTGGTIWPRKGGWSSRLRYGPLSLPKFWRENP